ncbi:hypothetical protein AYK24_06860 [Thermoplasmatales archaeon SG8-52-4]|nr:MAG: hypothetical protein AYK24_06860 [Thermoplasmatales archaeon SG8-52-4]
MNKKILIAGFFVSVMLLVPINSAYSNIGIQTDTKPIIQSNRGDTLYVGGSGPGNYSNIQDAIDNATNGTTIFVYDDSSPYIESPFINKSINLIGESKNTTVIDGNSGGSVFIITADWVNLSCFTIQNSEKAGINSKASHLKIIDNIFINNEWCGIYLESSHHNVICKNVIDNNGHGLYLKSNNNIISENIISSNNNGIFFASTKGNTVKNNSIIDNSNNGIDLSLGRDNLIENNDIISSKNGIWVFDTKNNTISGNNINKNSDGIQFVSSDHINIYGNDISDNNIGIILGNSVENNFIDNIFLNNIKKGIYLESSSYNNKISNNIFSDNLIGFHIRPDCSDNIISDNMFFNDGLFIESSLANIYLNNTVNGKPLYLLKGEKNKVLDNINAGQIILINCNSITINNNDLSGTTIGIELFYCNYCIISGNNLSNNNQDGIFLRGSKNSITGNYISNNNRYGIYIIGNNNSISRNHIMKNSYGLYWDGNINIVVENNFISNNNRDAHFRIDDFDVFSTNWNRNFWDRGRIISKAIFGIKLLLIYSYYKNGHYYYLSLWVPWIVIDKNPAKVQYKI